MGKTGIMILKGHRSLIYLHRQQLRLAPLLRADRVLILDLNDGIGPYSRSYHDPTQAKFDLLILPRRNVPDVFDAHLDSPVGPVLIKSYTCGLFDTKTELTVNGDEFTFVARKTAT